jgi:hypothetical protein
MTTRIITYNENFSVNHSPKRDLEIGSQNRIVGANYYLDNASPGDLVVIKANERGVWYIQIGRLDARLDNCSLWRDSGGPVIWRNNFNFTPLTPIFRKNDIVNNFIREKCESSGVTTHARWFFHPRFHNHRWVQVLNELVDLVNLTNL